MSSHDPLEEFVSAVRDAVARACKSSGFRIPEETRPDEAFGDLAYACHSLAKEAKMSPQAIAEKMCSAIQEGELFTAEAVKGYVNFRFRTIPLASGTIRCTLSRKGRYGWSDHRKPKVLVEHTSANPTGPLHVGRARNPIIGDTLARLLEASGHDVVREYLVNDIGRQVATLTWGCLNLPGVASTPEGIVELYRQASALEAKDEKVKGEISELLRKMEAGDKEICSAAKNYCTIVLEDVFKDLETINVRFDGSVWESDLVLRGDARKVLDRLMPHVREKGGSKYIDLGDDDALTLVRADGTTLYPLRDVSYHLDKGSRASIMINIVGEDHKLEMKGVVRMLSLLGAKTPECVFYSMVSLPEGRMSTRAGNVVYLKDLVDEAVARAVHEIKSRRSDIDDQRVAAIARSIGSGAVRFNILRIQAEKSMVFNWKDALNFEGESAPYVQYAHARCMSIFEKANELGKWSHGPEMDGSGFVPDSVEERYELPLIRAIARFPSFVSDLAERRVVHPLPAYACSVADRFNQYYEHVRVLESEHWRSRLELVAATRWTLRNAIELMGIDPIDEM